MEVIGTLAGGVAHDFNNLLGGILGYASLLRSQIDEMGEIQGLPNAAKYLRNIERSAVLGAELTAKLLTVARRTAKRLDAVNLNTVAEETISLLTRTLNKNIRIEKHLDSRLRPFLGDSTQIQQVVLNLSVNARDAMPGGGRLLIGTELGRDGKTVRLCVHDTGVGMDDVTAARIFDPFFSTKGASGTGLGLAVVYGIVKSHGGDVHVASTPGEGTRFDVVFPARWADREERCEEAGEAIRGRGELILLVDDEELIQDLGRSILERFGFRVEPAETGEEALVIVRDRRDEIRLIILDLIMPGLDGTETCRRLKSVAPEIPILISSGLGQDSTVQEALRKGASGFLAKPFSVEELTQAVSSALAGGGDPMSPSQGRPH